MDHDLPKQGAGASVQLLHATVPRLPRRRGGAAVAPGTPPEDFTALDLERREYVSTEVAAYHLNRRPATLRGWASAQDGLLMPLNAGGRLLWRVAELRRILKVDPLALPRQ